MLGRPRSFLAAAALAALVAGCAAPTPPAAEGPYQAEGAFVGDPTLLPMALAVLAADPTVAPVATAATELVPGLYVVGSGFIGEDGEMTLTFVEAEEVPDEVLLPASEAFLGGWSGAIPAGCTFAASDPAARVVGFGIASISTAPFAYGFTPGGTGLLLLATTTIGPVPSSLSLIVFVFADRAVTITSAGTCADGSQDLTVDVELDAGWNRVALRLNLAAPPMRVIVEDDDGTVLLAQEP